jgi:hypothetical protein
MPTEPEGPSVNLPGPGQPFNPRKVFRSFGLGVLIPERVAASRLLSMTAKVCYGHLVRRAGKNDLCWPSYWDITESIGVKERHAMRAIKELTEAQLIRRRHRTAEGGRQTSNNYEFIWGPILQGEGDGSDTLPPDKSDAGRVTYLTPTRVSKMTPLEVKKINHHQGRKKQRRDVQADSTADGYSSLEFNPPSSDEVDDDKPSRTQYASGKDELKAIYLAKTGESFRVADLDAIESILFAAAITWEIFAAEARKHAWSSITNPVGFLKSLAKRFRAKTQVSSPPLTAAEADAKNYRCDICGSPARGQGARLIDGKEVPCSCASPEYIAHQRARGVFAAEEPPE